MLCISLLLECAWLTGRYSVPQLSTEIDSSWYGLKNYVDRREDSVKDKAKESTYGEYVKIVCDVLDAVSNI